mmetsp:Transcript_42502/g.99550  ORF Transcript_42502/g.99550 Transcript_42502/m.99550 type:complete len:232 (-) Transcript_42502:520-1215(-)
MRMTAVTGTASTSPGTPQSVPHSMSESNTTTGCSSSEWPKRIGSRKLPTTACTESGRVMARTALNVLYAGSKATTGTGSSVAITAPKLGMKLSQKASTAKTSHNSTFSAHKMSAVTAPTKKERNTFPLMKMRICCAACLCAEPEEMPEPSMLALGPSSSSLVPRRRNTVKRPTSIEFERRESSDSTIANTKLVSGSLAAKSLSFSSLSVRSTPRFSIQPMATLTMCLTCSV